MKARACVVFDKYIQPVCATGNWQTIGQAFPWYAAKLLARPSTEQMMSSLVSPSSNLIGHFIPFIRVMEPNAGPMPNRVNQINTKLLGSLWKINRFYCLLLTGDFIWLGGSCFYWFLDQSQMLLMHHHLLMNRKLLFCLQIMTAAVDCGTGCVICGSVLILVILILVTPPMIAIISYVRK